MSDLILHHYPASPFAEKIRAILGYKALPYRSVLIPLIMPKPDLTALTGGYRKTPVLQIGSHIYCDTRLMARVLDQRAPERALIPSGQEASANIMAQWIDAQVFELSVASVFSPAGMAALKQQVPEDRLQALLADRMAMRKNAATPPATPEKAQVLLPVYLSQFEQQLAGGSTFLLGPQPALPDFSLYHCVWFIAGNPGVAPMLDAYPHLQGWLAKMAAFGKAGKAGAATMSSTEALAEASDCGADCDAGEWCDNQGLTAGTRVSVMPADTRQDPVEGELVIARLDEIAVRRQDDRAGAVIVHFPRVGYQVAAV
ncbi:glutathione S-transferase family protein [Exilibacterium tricleocarpae]|uniref:Glutathione S-transferase family protein n=1 Tax=Exilibacterium tricleocarpae TaxID=2591008 RepID=A0A545TS58_9GAMM|nr:glutathione S-transferase family protein [Exilibacterium tricleocarpae]TQV80058.1 glutathione S-transferase family protein [Exilibacterium tricleocarpae]